MKISNNNKLLNTAFVLVAVIVLAADQYTKYWINMNLPTSSSIEVIPNIFYITHIKNTGAAFGLFPNGTQVLIIISVIAILLIIVIKIILKIKSYFFNIALGLIMGGALGNLIRPLFHWRSY
ncbi:MAG: signal peptidase II [Actinomycetota bacterium]|nr:signal peptidase II [Actinomycetota bacterium]